MNSKRELEAKLQVARDFRRDALEGERKAQERARRFETAIVRLAKHFGFHDRYQGEKRAWVKDTEVGGYWTIEVGFIVDDLIADLDTIDQARSADEARTRLGIKEES